MQIHIKNLNCFTIIGVYEHERIQRQLLIINLKIDINPKIAVETDNIFHTLDYNTLSQKVVQFVESSNYHLIERLASEITDLVLEEEQAISVEIELDKPGALDNAESVSIKYKKSK